MRVICNDCGASFKLRPATFVQEDFCLSCRKSHAEMDRLERQDVVTSASEGVNMPGHQWSSDPQWNKEQEILKTILNDPNISKLIGKMVNQYAASLDVVFTHPSLSKDIHFSISTYYESE